jgi:hypothetical protein
MLMKNDSTLLFQEILFGIHTVVINMCTCMDA